ncbi:MAG TPA: MFS transporter [Opitutus sp.]|nr:MFS transporter [Opitutus sp.]
MICALLFAATTINYIDRQILALLKPQLDQELGWTNEKYGQMISAFQAAYPVSYVAFGWLIDRVGVRMGYSISIVCWSLAAMAHGFVGSVRGFFLARLALGAGEGGNFPACIKAIAHWFPPRERAFAASFFNSGTNIAAIIAPAVVPWIAFTWGWQMCFIIAGLAGFAWLIFWIPLYRNEPSESRLVSEGERAHIERDQAHAAAASGQIGWLGLFKYRQTWAIVLAKVLTDPVWWFFLIWLPDFFKKTRGLDLKNSWVHLVSIYAISTVLSLAGGWLSGNFIKRGWTTTRARKTAMFLFSLAVIPVVFAPQSSEWLAVFFIGLAGAAHQAWSATIYASTSDMFPRKSIAAIAGVAGMAGSVGGIFFPTFAGKLLDHYKLTPAGESAGYAILFTICGSAYVVAFLINHVLAPRFEQVKIAPKLQPAGGS